MNMNKQIEIGHMKKQCVVLLFVLCLAILEETKAVELEKWHIHVVNGLSNGQILLAHCKSKDNDLGERRLIAGTEFNWRFRVNFWNTTLFWCYLQKPNGQHSSFESFWIESRSVWLYTMCFEKNCIWTAKDDGIYLKDNFDTHKDILIHKWE
ncbi:S-protein homolog 1-like [Cucumis sativus]|uniref:S-protein homolog 1-like n=1 Tax=Cucumis sativus TaxID=3659 RepID=UPI0012F4BFFA|nr:S-protein homolog 1-like [Cucumis sativus]